MIKRAIRLTSLVFGILVSLLVFRHITSMQQCTPFGTTDQFELNIFQSNLSEKKIISDLNKIVDKSGATVVKVSPDPEHYVSKKDIIWFGSTEPKTSGVIVENQKIRWLDSSFTGQLISSSNMGIHPITGMYAVKGGQIFQDEINTWAESNGFQISWVENLPLYKEIFLNLSDSGVGNAVVASFLLVMAVLISWFVVHAKSRTLRLLGGVGSNRIHFEDLMTIVTLMTPSILAGWIISLGYIALVSGVAQISLVVWQTLTVVVATLALIGACAIGFSFIASPKPQHIAQRKIPLKGFSRLGTPFRIATIVLALLIVPPTVTAAYTSHQLSKEHALWQSMKKTMRLSFNDIDALETQRMLPEVEKLFSRMQQEDNLRLSLVVDEAILLEKEELGNYDHIIIADRAWVDELGVGIGTQGTTGSLAPIEFKNLATPLAAFLNAQLPLLTKTEEVQPEGLGFYKYTGDKFLALPPNMGVANETIQARNPLVILVNDPVGVLKTKSMLLPSASTGNVVFPDEEQLRLALSNSPMKPYVASIDGIADLALEKAEMFRQEATYYVIACVLILMAMVFVSVLSAQIWAGSKQKHIFTLHTSGKTYNSVIKPSLMREISIATITVIIGTIISFKMKHPELSVLVFVALSIALLYGCGSFIAYRRCASQAFHKMSHRYY